MNGREIHLQAIEMARHGRKAECLEIVERLARMFHGIEEVAQQYRAIADQLVRDDCFLVDVREALETALERIDRILEEEDDVQLFIIPLGKIQREDPEKLYQVSLN